MAKNTVSAMIQEFKKVSETITQKKTVDLSIILICFNMQREIVRTIESFLPPYQVGTEDYLIEIIVIDTGSDRLPDLSQFQHKIKFVQFKTEHPSPVAAINYGIKIAQSDYVGVLIDGARMVTPGICRDAIAANKLAQRVFVSTLAFHFGPIVQMHSVFAGYDQVLEDKLLQAIDWRNNGYDLYLISCLAQSSINGLYGPIAESNAIFANKDIWHELNGFDERFVSIGGGLSNLDVYKRASELADIRLIRLTNETTFHQVHGGVATNNKMGKYNQIFFQEYQEIRGTAFAMCEKVPELYGELLPQVAYFFGENKNPNYCLELQTKQLYMNQILAKYTDKLQFEIKT